MRSRNHTHTLICRVWTRVFKFVVAGKSHHTGKGGINVYPSPEGKKKKLDQIMSGRQTPTARGTNLCKLPLGRVGHAWSLASSPRPGRWRPAGTPEPPAPALQEIGSGEAEPGATGTQRWPSMGSVFVSVATFQYVSASSGSFLDKKQMGTHLSISGQRFHQWCGFHCALGAKLTAMQHNTQSTKCVHMKLGGQPNSCTQGLKCLYRKWCCATSPLLQTMLQKHLRSTGNCSFTGESLLGFFATYWEIFEIKLQSIADGRQLWKFFSLGNKPWQPPQNNVHNRAQCRNVYVCF